MTVVYFVLSHTNVSHVVRLVRRIRDDAPKSVVLIHHDATLGPFDRDAFAFDERVVILDRWIHGEWAGFSLVEIVLSGFTALAERGVDYDWIALLSGQDYPVRPLAEFEAALAASGDGFLDIDSNPGTLLDRYRFRWYRLARGLENGLAHRAIGFCTRFNDRQPWVRFLSGRVGCRIAVAMRRSPLKAGERIFKGTQWWTLSRAAVAYVVAFVSARPDFVRHYREHTIMPDESFFQTILLNAGPRFRFSTHSVRFTKWGPHGSASPEILRLEDYEDIVRSRAFFARKFDPTIDATIVSKLE